ncbi:MAG: CotH kinase family protein [Myxococcota bacterium]|nr:CotH kinase family protein [Myxococcota bacterium]
MTRWPHATFLALLGALVSGCGGTGSPVTVERFADVPKAVGTPDATAAEVSIIEEVVDSDGPDHDVSGPDLPPWCAPPLEAATVDRDRLFSGETIATVDLALPPESWASLEDQPRQWVEGSLSYTDETGLWGPLPVGLRLKGGGEGDPADGSFQPLDGKPAFKVDMNRIMECGHLHGLTKLTLNNMVQDPTALRERLGYRLAREAGVPAARSAHVWLTLNGAPLGLYAHVESYDQRTFLDDHFTSTGHLYEEHIGSDLRAEDIQQFDVDRGPEEDRSDLEAVVQALEASTGDLIEETGSVIAWEPTLRFMVVEQLMGHWDGYSGNAHNVFFHFTEEGELTLLPWGLDQVLFFQGPGLHQGKGILHHRCMNDAGCRQQWNERVGELVPLFHQIPEWVTTELAVLEDRIALDPRRPWSLEEHEAAVEDLLAFSAGRPDEAASAIACAEDPALDQDQDGHPCLSDCDDQSPSTHPGAVEACDPPWQDENCDGDFGEVCLENP